MSGSILFFTQASFVRRSRRSIASEVKPLLPHRCSQEERDRLCVGSRGPAPIGNEEAEVRHVHAGVASTARMVELLPGNRDFDGGDRAILAWCGMCLKVS